MDFKHLETFLTVVEWGSFSDAAKRLYLSQPTVSIHIKQLEEELNTKLIKRTTKSHELTDEGREFYKYAKSISQIIENAKNTFNKVEDCQLTIGASSIPATYLLPPLMKTFYDKYPNTLLTLEQGDSNSVIDQVANGRINSGVVGSTAMNTNLVFEELCEDRLVFVTPNNERFSEIKQTDAPVEGVFDMLLKENFVSREQGSGTQKEATKMLHALDIDSAKLKTVAIGTTTEAIKSLVKSGLGIAILSEIAVEEDVKNGSLISFDIDEIESYRKFYLVYRKNSLISKNLNNWMNFLRVHFKS